jgi:hypothetical protein
MPSLRFSLLASCLLPTAFLGCTKDQALDADARLVVRVRGPSDPKVTDACYDLELFRTADPATFDPKTVVWSESRVCLSGHGEAGALHFAGRCDPIGPSRDNALRLTLVDLYTGGDEHTGTRLADGDFINPCPAATPETPNNGCVLSAPCVAATEARVDFDLALARRGDPGFFETGVRFADVFCTARLDCSDDGAARGSDSPGASEGAPSDTAVLGLVCAGANGTPAHMYLDDLRVTCSDANGRVSRTARVDPSAGPGRVSPVGAGGAPVLSEASTTLGEGPEGARSWEVRLGLERGAFPGERCVLQTRATAAASPLDDRATPAYQRYPVLTWEVPLTADGARVCAQQRLNDGTGIATRYITLAGTHTFDTTLHDRTASRLRPAEACPAQATWPCDDGVATTIADRCDGAGRCAGQRCEDASCVGDGARASGPEGTRLSQGGVSLTVPSGASLYVRATDRVPPTTAVSGVMIKAITPVFELGPPGTTFPSPLEVSFDVGEAGSVTVFWSEDGAAWEAVPSTREGRVVRVATSHFSFAVVGADPCAGKAVGATCGAAPAGLCAAAPTCQDVGGNLSCVAAFKPATKQCRASAGGCDAAEYCTGTSASCPGDALQPAGFTCRSAVSTCDLAETCSGTSAACPADAYVTAGTTCRAGAGPCDVPEVCRGNGPYCPSDVFAATSVTCRPANGTCDAPESCTGNSAQCPADTFKPITTTCREANGTCDSPESCSGNYPTCPADTFKPPTVTCRDADGTCDSPESCTGNSAQCPADTFKPITTTCREADGVCDSPESCTGNSPTCPDDSLASASTECRPAAGACDTAETCTGTSTSCPEDSLASAATVCRPATGACDTPETCSGTSTACPDDVLAPAEQLCRPTAGACDTGEACTGTSPSCPEDAFLPTTTMCRAAGGVCDRAETCTGASADCPQDAFLGAEQLCRPAAGPCDAPETCAGTSAACPIDALEPTTTVCRPAVGVCDAAETCTGDAITCPADLFLEADTDYCRDVGTCEVKLLGGAAGEEFGFGFSAIGDINGDGKDDVGVGARNQATGASRIGKVYIIDGTVLGHYDVADPTGLGKTLGSWTSGVAGDAFGTSLAVGDVTHDGVPDLVVGAPETPNTQYGVCKDGMIHVWAGPLPGTALATAASATASIRGLGTYVSPVDGKLRCESDRIGYRLSTADVSGDGVVDILSASTWPLAVGSRNAAYIFAGPVSGALGAASARTQIHPTLPEASFAAFQNVGWGDFNGDGIADMLLGNVLDDSGAVDAGAVYLFNGPVAAGTLDVTAASAKIVATTEAEHFGNLGDGHFSVADFDGDGFDDLLVGSFGETFVGATAGAVYLFHGPLSGNLTTADAGARWYGSQAAGEAADSAQAGDINGDGELDIIIGSDGANYGGERAGGTYVYYGPHAGDYLLTDANLILHGSNAQDEVGFWVTGIGDVNSDGLDDIAITAPWDDENGLDAGAVYICFGHP